MTPAPDEAGEAPSAARGEVALRPVTEGDREFLCELYSSTRTEELSQVPWTDEQKRAFLWSQFEAQDDQYHRAYPDGVFSIILLSTNRAGRFYLRRGERDTRIVDLAILPAYRGWGIASQLLGDLARDADRADRTLSIHVEVFNTGARRLYERFGFVLVEDKGVYLLLSRPPSPARSPPRG